MVNYRLPPKKRRENFKKMEQVSFEKKKSIFFDIKNKSYNTVPDIVRAQYLNKFKKKKKHEKTVCSLSPTVLAILDVI